MSTMLPKAIIGLANPGKRYQTTRHNAGSWLVSTLAQQFNQPLILNNKLLIHYGKIELANQSIHLAIPTTFMNHSGQAVALLANYFKLTPEQLLICHDELDLVPGRAKFKLGGGHGGHNGLRDIINAFGQNHNFARLRIGIGHPGIASEVIHYVLSAPTKKEQNQIDRSIDFALKVLPLVLQGQWLKAMDQLHAQLID